MNDQDPNFHLEKNEGIIGAIKDKHGSKEYNQAFHDAPFNQFTIPDLSERVRDAVLGALVNGAWIRRRVIVTRDRISFALVDNEYEIDVIPMAEITGVEEMTSTTEPDGESLGQDGGAPTDRKLSAMPQASFKFLHRPSVVAALTDSGTNSVAAAASSGGKDATQLFVNALHIATAPDGYNSGRSYYLQAPSGEEKARLISLLGELSLAARKRAETRSRFEKSQDRVRGVYVSFAFQSVAALLIVANFLANLLEAQFASGAGEELLNYALNVCNLFFTAVFAAELAVNAYAHWLRPFVQNPWSMLDAFIVIMSLAALGPVDLPVSVLRLMRAFRVIRLFGRLKALKKMISALTASIVPMLNAFLILFIIASIYSVMGVSLFADDSFQDFGRFTNAFVTMFHLTSEGAWPPGLAAYDEAGTPDWLVTAFCMSYVVLVNWVVLQVSVAVLLDNFVSASAKIEEAERRSKREDARRRQQTRSPLEPLLKKLTREFVDDADLSEKLRRLYQFLDCDSSGSLSCEEFCVAIKKLDFHPRIHVAPSDFLGLTRSGQLCDEEGDLGSEAFEQAMRDQIRMYTQGQLCNPEQRSRAEAEQTHLAALKWLMVEQQRAHRDLQYLRGALAPSPLHHLPSDRGDDDRFEATPDRASTIPPSLSAAKESLAAAALSSELQKPGQKAFTGSIGSEGNAEGGGAVDACIAGGATASATPPPKAAVQMPSRLSWAKSFRMGAASQKSESTQSVAAGAGCGSDGGGGGCRRGETTLSMMSASWSAVASSFHTVTDLAPEHDGGTSGMPWWASKRISCRNLLHPDSDGQTFAPLQEQRCGGAGGSGDGSGGGGGVDRPPPSALGSVVTAVRRRTSDGISSLQIAPAVVSPQVAQHRAADQAPCVPIPKAAAAVLGAVGGSVSASVAANASEPLAAAATALAAAVCELVRAELGEPARALAAAASRAAKGDSISGGSRRRRLCAVGGIRGRRQGERRRRANWDSDGDDTGDSLNSEVRIDIARWASDNRRGPGRHVEDVTESGCCGINPPKSRPHAAQAASTGRQASAEFALSLKTAEVGVMEVAGRGSAGNYAAAGMQGESKPARVQLKAAAAPPGAHLEHHGAEGLSVPPSPGASLLKNLLPDALTALVRPLLRSDDDDHQPGKQPSSVATVECATSPAATEAAWPGEPGAGATGERRRRSSGKLSSPMTASVVVASEEAWRPLVQADLVLTMPAGVAAAPRAAEAMSMAKVRGAAVGAAGTAVEAVAHVAVAGPATELQATAFSPA